MIEILNISKKYKQNQVLKSVSFTVNDNEIVAFLGANGAGKSTTLKIASGFLTPDSGEVRINGKNIAQNTENVQSMIGYLPENNPLYPEMYVKEYLEYVAGLYQLGEKTKECVEKVIEQTGLQAEYQKKIGQLSKGYKQRVGLAQAIIHNPQVLLLDEPTTGLDPIQHIEIRELIKELGKEKSILFSTHNLEEAALLCKRVVIINKGNIVINDFIKELSRTKSLEELFLL